jgi:peptidoglycan-associated lipoprotein
MRRILSLIIPALAAIVLAGCPAKPKNGECKTSADCAEQEGYGKVCVEGRCQECAADSDCKEGFVCRANKCEPKPECRADADCGEGRVCQAEKCVAKPPECRADADCGEGKSCDNGRCIVNPAAAAAESACGDPSAFTIHFGFDQSVLTSESQQTLQKLSDCLKRLPAKKVTVAGHCDERGTTQYNLALGGRRAAAAKKYLADLGSGGHMDTVSYGKEKPVCTESTEACWAQNRRAEFQISR